MSTPSTPQLEISGSRNFTSWQSEQGASLAFTTDQSGKLFLLGVKPDGLATKVVDLRSGDVVLTLEA